MAPAPHRRILLVAYTYPPMPSVGANRWAALVPYLREMGHEVRILTTDAFGTHPGDDADVIRTTDLTGSKRVRALLRRPPIVPASGPAAAVAPAPDALMRLVVPDPYLLSWAAPAIPALRREVARWRPDCVISTSPYESTHLAPLALGRRRPPWIVDLRDGWCFEPHRLPFYTGVQRRLDAALERRVLRAAEVVVGVSMPYVDDARGRLGVPAEYVPNGWDPRLEREVGEAPSPVDPAKVTLAYTGSLAGSGGRDPRTLIDALRTLKDQERDLADRFELVIAGQPGPDDERLIAEAAVGDLVRHLGRVPRAEAIALQRGADALLLLTSAAGPEAPAKLFEYLASGRPILTLTGASEAARIVRETGTGEIVPADDRDAIVGALRDVLSGRLAERYAPRGLDLFVYPEPARRMADAIELAIQRRATA
jgi:glycosyltransferase involved in cell wall biosynthesis